MKSNWVEKENNKYELYAYDENSLIATIMKVRDEFIYYLDDPDYYEYLESDNIDDAKQELQEILLISFKDEIDYYNDVIEQINNMK